MTSGLNKACFIRGTGDTRIAPMPCFDAFLKIDVAEPVVLGGCVSCHDGHSGLNDAWTSVNVTLFGKGGFLKMKKKLLKYAQIGRAHV